MLGANLFGWVRISTFVCRTPCRPTFDVSSGVAVLAADVGVVLDSDNNDFLGNKSDSTVINITSVNTNKIANAIIRARLILETRPSVFSPPLSSRGEVSSISISQGRLRPTSTLANVL